MATIGTQLLDVAIGLMFVYIVASLIASTVVELLETFFRSRSKYLWQGIGELLHDPSTRAGANWASLIPVQKGPRPDRKETPAQKDHDVPLTVSELYSHPMIAGLFYGDYADATRKLFRRRLPSYISRESFSAALIDDVSRRGATRVGSQSTSVPQSTIESFRKGVTTLRDTSLRRALESILKLSGDDITLVQKRIEAWYDSAMDRIAGWYKRRTQVMLFVVGMVLAVTGNVDSVALVVDLVANEPKRQALAESAGAFVASQAGKDPALTRSAVTSYLGAIDPPPLRRTAIEALQSENWASTLFGWMITALAVSLGAPFWFDLLNKFMVVRSTVKPREKSQDEGSEDRGAKAASGSGSAAPSVFFQRGCE